MAIWSPDLSTEDGALGAAQMGSFACLVSAVLTLLGAVMSTGLLTSTQQGEMAIFVIVFALISVLIYTIAGVRLRAGKGVFWASAVVLLLALDLLARLVALSVLGIIIDVILLAFVINGIRGAHALHSGQFDSEAVADIFR